MNARASHTLMILLCASTFASSARAVTYTASLLHPFDFLDTTAVGISNASQVGSGFNPAFTGGPHALLWTGTAASVVDLHPATGFNSTYATAARSVQQVGYGSGPATGGNEHALLWAGTAASVVDLNPAGIDVSYAHGISGSFQVGYGFNTTDFQSHALLWNNTAASKVDLNPAGFTESYANAALRPPGSNATAVGSGAGSATGGQTHALLWSQSFPVTKVDLHPTSGFTFSEALGISAAGQVGDGFGASTTGAYHALYWNSTAASVIDLHPSLSALGYEFVSSTAFAIADNGTIVGTAQDDGFNNHAILWTPTPDSGVASDYNNNGTVDAGDFIAWRKGNTTLFNEVATIGSNTPEDYTEWRKRFGNPPGSGTERSGALVPEPTNCALVAYCICVMLLTRPRGCHWLCQCFYKAAESLSVHVGQTSACT